MLTETIITAATSQMIKSLVEKVIAPRFETFIKSFKADYKSILDKNKDYFGEYYHRTYEKYSVVNTLVFHNSQRLLKDIYVAQELVKENRFEGVEETIRIDGMPKEQIKKYKKILITDTAGMGKSTISKRMFIDLIDNGIEGIGVPIYIELNRLNKDRSILQEIQDGLSSLSEEFDNKLLLKFIQTGGFIFFLDGYDEISIADRHEVTRDIQQFISKAGTKNYYILTSRPEEGLASFGDFQSFKIKPLTKKEAFELLKKYDGGEKKVLSGKLVKLLKSGEYDSIDEYLENPLLVSLLYAAFDHKQIIPLKKHLFYRQVYEAYFDSHDLAKGIDARQKHSGLDIDDFNRVLRYVGYECLIRVGVQFDKDKILSSIDRAREYCGNLSFGSNDFLKDLMTTVPLFTKDGPEYKWAHKSLMEYFAARFIAEDAKDNQDKFLNAIYQSEQVDKYINMLDLYFDIDLKGFSKNITLPLCEQYIEFYKDKWIDSDIRDGLVKERIGKLFSGNVVYLIIDHKITVQETRDMFREFSKFIGKDDFNVDTTFAFGSMIVRAGKNKSIEDLLRLKIPSLFDYHYHQNRPDFGISHKDIHYSYGIPINEIITIDMRTGLESGESAYELYNYIMGDEAYWLDYEACAKEAGRIRKEIAQNKDISNLMPI